MPSAAGTAYLLLAASRPGPAAYAAVLKQLANLAKALHDDMHRADAAARRARTIRQVVRGELATVSRRLQAAGVGAIPAEPGALDAVAALGVMLIGSRLSHPDAARLLVATESTKTRDALGQNMSRDIAREHSALWADLTRRAPDEVRTPTATLLPSPAGLRANGGKAWWPLTISRRVRRTRWPP